MIPDRADLSKAQVAVLKALANGHVMVFSQDGDYAWLSPKHQTGMLSDEQTIGLRKAGYIEHMPDPDDGFDRFGPPDTISRAGRAALKEMETSDD